jgi:hypothetical protein
MNTIFGMKIVVDKNIQPVPRMQVSPEFARIQSPELVASTNAWMREFFGTYLPYYVIGGSTVVMHPRHVAMLRLNSPARSLCDGYPEGI